VWRTLLIANEFNELQTYRVISVEWTLFILAFFLEGLQWKNLAVLTPSVSLSYSDQQNYILRYFLCSFVYLVIGLS
jgi:meckelin